MEFKDEIIKKYRLFFTAKKLTIALGTICVICLTLFLILKKYNLELLSILLLSLSILSFVIFIIFWIAIKPMKNHILDLIKEYEQK
jgi:cobalamin biosynthesis protein CobD/CbiB